MSAVTSSSTYSNGCCPPGSLSFLDAGPDVANSLKGRCVSVTSEGCSEPCSFYITAPDANFEQLPSKAIIVISDVWGWNSGRIRAIADYFMGLGYVAIIPKVLEPALEGGTDGDALPPKFDMPTRGPDFMAWIKTITWPDIRPKVACSISFLKSKGVLQIGMIGFCFGGWVCAQAIADPITYPFVLCYASPHPSVTLEERAYGGNTIDLIGRGKRPALFLPAGNDPTDYREGGAFLAAAKAGDAKSRTIATFEDMKHGWCNRGDIESPEVKAQVDSALKYIGDFIAENLA